MIKDSKLINHFKDLNLRVEFHANHISCVKLDITNDYVGMIKEKQLVDPRLKRIVQLLDTNQAKVMGVDEGLRFREKFCVPTDGELKRMI